MNPTANAALNAPHHDGRTALAHARTFLFVPATRPDRFAKALASGADAVIIDLEDAVAPADKGSARQALVQAWPGIGSADRHRLLIRINARGTDWQAGDLTALAALGITGVMVPKAETAADLITVAAALGPHCVLVPLVESAAGLVAVTALAGAPQVLRLAFGHLDYQVDLGMACDGAEVELIPARHAIVLASRVAGLAPALDGVTQDTGDASVAQADARRARRAGFGGKLCIHPAQVAPVRWAFAPSPQEQAWARRVLAAAAGASGGAIRVDGRMVDAPVLALARRVLADGAAAAAA